MNKYTLDASALLAALLHEPGGDLVHARGHGSAISAVNYSEVVSKLVDHGSTEQAIRSALAPMELNIVPFDGALAIAAGLLRAATRPFGLSFGDRACLSLALQLKLPVLTADRAWKKLKLDLKIEPIR